MTQVRLDKLSRTDLSIEATSARPTPSSGASFREVMGRSASQIVAGAQDALDKLPGGPVLAAAVRAGASAAPAGATTTTTAMALQQGSLPLAAGAQGATVSLQAEGPASASQPTGGGLEGTLASSQNMNLYYLQMQESLSAENRAYTACSNVLKARHDTVKNAIGNIR